MRVTGDYTSSLSELDSPWQTYIALLVAFSIVVWLTASDTIKYKTISCEPVCSISLLNHPNWESVSITSRTDFTGKTIKLYINNKDALLLVIHLPVQASGNEKAKRLYFRLTGDIKNLSDAKFRKDSSTQTLIVFRTFTNDDKIDKNHVKKLKNIKNSQSISVVLPVSETAVELRIAFRLNQPGTYEIDNLHVDTVSIRKEYMLIKGTLAMFSAGLAVYFMFLAAGSLSIVWLIALISLSSLTILLTSLESETVSRLTVWLAGLTSAWDLPLVRTIQQFAETSRVFRQADQSAANNLGHVMMFFLISFTLFSVRRKLLMSIAQAALLLLAISALSEAAQRHVWSRSPSIWDFVLNGFGIFLGFITWTIGRNLLTKK